MDLKQFELSAKKALTTGTIKKIITDLTAIIVHGFNQNTINKKKRKEELEYKNTVISLLVEIRDNLKELNNKEGGLKEDKIINKNSEK